MSILTSGDGGGVTRGGCYVDVVEHDVSATDVLVAVENDCFFARRHPVKFAVRHMAYHHRRFTRTLHVKFNKN